MPNSTNKYKELEDRSTDFAKRVIRLCKALPNDTINRKLVDQIIRSSGSIGANYREANESVSKRDFLHRIKISRKEAKETRHWLELVAEANPFISPKMEGLVTEIDELRNIFSAIIAKVENKK